MNELELNGEIAEAKNFARAKTREMRKTILKLALPVIAFFSSLSNGTLVLTARSFGNEDFDHSIQTGRHETYLHAIIDGVHSPDNRDLFHIDSYTDDYPRPRLYERYLYR